MFSQTAIFVSAKDGLRTFDDLNRKGAIETRRNGGDHKRGPALDLAQVRKNSIRGQL